MPDERIKSAMQNCPWRDNRMNGERRDDRLTICRGYCLPCLRVIDNGKCPTLIELFKTESEE